MSHKDELLEIARVLRSQAEGRGPAKRNLRHLADHYQREAEHLLELRRLKRRRKKRGHAA
jgi:hypothetical protein